MFSEEPLELRQKNELESLQAIYGGDVRDLREKPEEGKWVPLDFSLSLFPQQGSSGSQENHVKIDLHIMCSDKYPNSVPIISLENSKGLSNTVVDELREKLEQKAEELKGEEMILQLCHFVQEFLLPYNKPTSKSFYDEMLQRQKEKEQMNREAEELEKERQRQTMHEEVQQRQEILKSEPKLRREYRSSSENDDNNERNIRFSSNRIQDDSPTEASGDSSCHHKGITVMEFGNKKIQRGRCIKHSTDNHVVFSGIDTETGHLVIVSEWNISIKNKKDLPHVSRQITSIEQEINKLVKFRHSNLAHYYNVKSITSESNVIVYLLKEFIYGSNCFSLFLSQNVKIDLDFLKHIAKGTLSALDYLHRNNTVHKDVRDTNIYLNSAGVVKLSNYSIHRRLLDLTSSTHGTYSKKTDILNFGKLLLSLLQGNSISDDTLEIPNSIQPDLHDFLTRCLATDESDRYTTTELLKHPFFYTEIVPSSPQHAYQLPALDRNVSPELIHPDLLRLSQSNEQSRFYNEFKCLKDLGKGAFGDVKKVQNKLDGGYYAIKRIRLNPKNKALNKKIVREVKLLSRLNHENVVRYYNSWIETTTLKEEGESSSNVSSAELQLPQVVRQDEFTLTDDIEAQAPPIKSVEVSITYDSKSQAAFDNSSDDDSSDEDGAWGAIYGEDSDSDGIEFECDSKSVPKENSASVPIFENSESPELTQEVVKQIDFMYIQMEFCEKSTLRTAIDNNLYLDEDKLWRLIREIVEGLNHIHLQGMIHRDLKPVNIFLDSGDHVKIGDFGLATMMIKPQRNESVLSRNSTENEREDAVDEGNTGFIGTALYVAPEISQAAKVVYNQKVDIYSLGIIFFEMCYKPLKTSMERIQILTNLRMKEIIFPDDFINKENEKKQFLIRWLLDHDISKRPTSQELLQSKYIPPVVEEASLRESVNHALSSPQLKAYKYLIASCFKQSLTPAQDITYDKDLSAPNTAKPLQLYDFIKETCIKIFRRHGGQNLSTPLLMPKSKFYEDIDSCVKLMTHFGTIVSLPHDLRVPFARYIAWNGITTLRRYSIERVYREKKVFGFQPRELYECAFDIVSPTKGNLTSDAELLYIVHEIINELPGVKNKQFLIKLNHTCLLKAILLHYGIKDQDHEKVYNMISDTKEGKVSRHQLQNYFITLGLSDNIINLLVSLFSSEYEMSKVMDEFHMITRKKSGEASSLAKQALEELKSIEYNAVAYGVKFTIVVSPGLVYNVKQYSGMICQFVCELKKKHKHGNMEVLAAGGRYDSMISWYRSIMEQASMLGKEIHQSAVGISISLDKLVQAVQKEEDNELPQIDCLDVVVCSLGSKQLINQKTKILRELWAAGIRCVLLDQVTNMEHVNLQANELKVPHIVILKDNDQGTVIVKTIRNWEKNLIQEKQCSISELPEQLQRIIKERNEGSQENVAAGSSVLSRSDSKFASGDQGQELKVEISFVAADKIDKLASHIRKRYENLIRAQLDGLFKKVTGDVLVLGLFIEASVIRTLASYLEFDSESHFHKTVAEVIEKHQRHKKYINNVCDKIYDHRLKNANATVVLFGLLDTIYKVIF